jgi:hypothetical protein
MVIQCGQIAQGQECDLAEGEQDMGKQANTIVRNHTGWAMVAAFIPLPIVDSAALVGVELDILRALTKCYDLP